MCLSAHTGLLMKRLWMLFVLLLLLCMIGTSAVADVPHQDMIPPLKEHPPATVPRGNALINGPTEIVTGKSFTWSTSYTPAAGNELVWYVINEYDPSLGVYFVSRVFEDDSFSWQADMPVYTFIDLYESSPDGRMNLLESINVNITGINYVDKRVAELVSQCVSAAGSDPYEQTLWLHDWLTHNANYDYTYSNFGPEGVLLHGTGVCDSFSKAYKRLLDALGFENERVLSDSMNHAWNYVRINGEWYETDVTWDDANRHFYLNLNSSIMSIDHYGRSISHSCNSLDANYFYRVGAGSAAAHHLLEHTKRQDGWISFSVKESDLYCQQCFVNFGLEKENNNSWDFGSDVDLSVFIEFYNFKGALEVGAWTIDGMTWHDASGSYRLSAGINGDVMTVSRIPVVSCTGVHHLRDDVCILCGETLSTSGLNVLLLPEELTEIADEAFCGTDFQCVIVPDSCIDISTSAFDNCNALQLVILPSSMESVAEELFGEDITFAVRVAE